VGSDAWSLSLESQLNKHALRVQQRLNTAWDNAIYHLKQMNQISVVKPTNPYDIFQIYTDNIPDDIIQFKIRPVVFNVPAHSRTPRTGRPVRPVLDLYIVIKGWLSFEGPDSMDVPLKTHKFNTAVGYFRAVPGNLEHIYGAHYDIDDEKPGHPVFHAQFCSQADFVESIRELFHIDDIPNDHLKNVLGTVRVPCAQMDIFSVMTQICADHLMWEKSGQDVKNAFQRMREECDFFFGAAHRMDFLKQPPASECYRSTYWYRSPLANA
jgi:hypothetical protein